MKRTGSLLSLVLAVSLALCAAPSLCSGDLPDQPR